MQNILKKHTEKLRFALVGGANTLLDFTVLFILVGFGLDRIRANFISTSIAFLLSFFVNKSFTFKSTGGNAKKQFILFILITICSLWIIQPIIITVISKLLSSFDISNSVVLFIAKLVATIASLIWNYILYSRFVFKKEK